MTLLAAHFPDDVAEPPALAPARPARWTERIPLPTPRTVALFALAMLPAILSVAALRLAWGSAVLAAALGLAFAIDALRLRGARLSGARAIPELLFAFSPNALTLGLRNDGLLALHGRYLDALPDGTDAAGDFTLAPREELEVPLSVAPPRGQVRFGDVFLRLEGPWRLASTQARLPTQGASKSYPDLRDPADALVLARARQEAGLARLRRLGEGREFDALRPYRQGDDLRSVDWKASARRAGLVTREYVPEKNQALLLLVDCGRFFVARERGRAKLDWAIEAALRLARTSLERGDAVGLIAFGAQVRAFVPPAKGRHQLRAITEAVYALEPALEESDYGAAFDAIGRATSRRALVCTFTDLVDEDASRVLLARTAALRPKHLPLVVTLLDAELSALATEVPADVEAALGRAAASRLLRARDGAATRLRQAGATVVSAPSDGLTAEAINAYLRIKARGLL